MERRQEEEFKRKVTLIDERTVKVNELKRRIINDSYRKQILDCICPYQNTKILVIANNSKESQEFSRQFEGIFKAAGWKVDHLLIGGLRRVHKMRVLKNSMYQESKSFEALSRAFRKCNLDFEHGETEGDSDDEIIFDAGVLEANDYQVAIDKID